MCPDVNAVDVSVFVRRNDSADAVVPDVSRVDGLDKMPVPPAMIIRMHSKSGLKRMFVSRLSRAAGSAAALGFVFAECPALYDTYGIGGSTSPAGTPNGTRFISSWVLLLS